MVMTNTCHSLAFFQAYEHGVPWIVQARIFAEDVDAAPKILHDWPALMDASLKVYSLNTSCRAHARCLDVSAWCRACTKPGRRLGAAATAVQHLPSAATVRSRCSPGHSFQW